MDTLSEENLSKFLCLSSEKDSTLKGKNLLLLGANSFLLKRTPSQKGAWCAGRQTKVVSLVKRQKITQVYSVPLKFMYVLLFQDLSQLQKS